MEKNYIFIYLFYLDKGSGGETRGGIHPHTRRRRRDNSKRGPRSHYPGKLFVVEVEQTSRGATAPPPADRGLGQLNTRELAIRYLRILMVKAVLDVDDWRGE